MVADEGMEEQGAHVEKSLDEESQNEARGSSRGE
jgi:hypothetical protein